MAEPFLGEIRMASFNFAPHDGWALCNGQLLPINQNQPLFALLGTMYGGNGQTTFALPDLRGKVPIHVGAGFTQGQVGGQESHTITQQEMPTHVHMLQATKAEGAAVIPTNAHVLATSNGYEQYRAPTSLTTMVPGTVTNVGGSQAHQNMQPFTVINFMIALVGIFPSQN
jgi:microcystin-dependent protein